MGAGESDRKGLVTEMADAMKVLAEETVYVAGDRFVCGSTRCAGMTAVYSGRDIDGVRLRAVDARDVKEWESYGLGALRCECGSVTA